MKRISLHIPSTPSHSPSTDKSKAGTPPTDIVLLPVPAAGMRVKGVRTLVRRLRGAIQIVARSRHHQSPAVAALVPAPPPSPDLFAPFVPSVPVPVDLALSSKHSDDSLTTTSAQSSDSRHPSRSFSSAPSSFFATAVDHSSSLDASLNVQSMSADESSLAQGLPGDASSYASAVPEGQSVELSEPSQGSLRADDTSASDFFAGESESSDAEGDDGDTSQQADASEPNTRNEERSSTLDDAQFGTSEHTPDSRDPAASPAIRESTESGVPDPFLEDDPEDPPVSSEQPLGQPAADQPPAGLSVDETAQSLAAADEVTLAQSPPPAWPVSVPNTAVDFNKAVPPPPHTDDDDDEDDEDTPELYLPGLVLPAMFLPIPNTDPLTTLLIKFIPPESRPHRDLSGNWQGADFNMLVMTNSWRALAKMARDRLVETDPEDLDLVLSLWYLRLSCLARLRLFNQTAAECTNLYTVLNGVEPAAAREWLFEKKVPFELEVLHARLKYWTADHMGYLDALAALLAECKARARAADGKADSMGAGMWQERGARVCLIIASQLIEMKDFAAAARLLEPLCKQPGGVTAPQLQSAVGRIYVQGGYIRMATKHFAEVWNDPTAEPSLKHMNAAVLAAADGDWPKAIEELGKMLDEDPENFIAINNLSVAYLSQGKIQEGIRVLEEAIKLSPSTTLAAEPLLFNLSTMYELRSTAGADRKRSLLIEVAKWAGDGLRTTCLKMPSN
ncbi:uncharacterized protein C8Q71DRAFT_483076 [Rhodofomes roseus]|uniref:Tetratricopeptide repeat protein n=1 Tax=Rhodofomes roseus TaxID=34475 RepID=A0ABQ8KP98_9APHY|nr:uncharacterized protein C8Q71DRAFT_483076 [Rhodofomes roseus]KAH9840252.1 hypothetical protein C8Q71DRAFT_483076 [Rhodofomes roseus]